jgi:hypothetical protein
MNFDEVRFYFAPHKSSVFATKIKTYVNTKTVYSVLTKFNYILTSTNILVFPQQNVNVLLSQLCPFDANVGSWNSIVQTEKYSIPFVFRAASEILVEGIAVSAFIG